MHSLLLALGFLQDFGLIVGAGGALIAELFRLKAEVDGKIDRSELGYLHIIYRTLHVGMLAFLAGTIALTFVEYATPGMAQLVLTPALWAEDTLVLILIANAYALKEKRVGDSIGSSLSLTTWWMLAAIGLMPSLSWNYLQILGTYLVLTLFVAGVMAYLRILITKAPTRSHIS